MAMINCCSLIVVRRTAAVATVDDSVLVYL